MRWLIFVGVALVLGILFALALRYLTANADEATDETRESVFSTDLLQEQWLALWRRWLQQLPRRAGGSLNPYLSLDGEAGPRRTIRALYQAVLALAQASGRARGRAQTPQRVSAPTGRTVSARGRGVDHHHRRLCRRALWPGRTVRRSSRPRRRGLVARPVHARRDRWDRRQASAPSESLDDLVDQVRLAPPQAVEILHHDVEEILFIATRLPGGVRRDQDVFQVPKRRIRR